jgi:hypothetical protein
MADPERLWRSDLRKLSGFFYGILDASGARDFGVRGILFLFWLRSFRLRAARVSPASEPFAGAGFDTGCRIPRCTRFCFLDS